MAVNIHITIIELNALHTKRQNLFQELDAVIHLLMEAKHWGLRKSRNATSLNSRFKSLDTLKVKIISVTFRRVIRTNHETNINIIARRTGKDVNSHTVLDGIITTIMATIQRINIIGSREGSRNRRRLKANQTGKKFRVGIKSNISTNRNNLISGVDRCIHLNAMKKTTITSINRQTIKI